METFFRECGEIDEVEIEELLLLRYNDVDYIMQKDLEDGLFFVRQMYESRRDEREFLQWVVQLPLMDKEHFISFPEYKEKIRETHIDVRPDHIVDKELEEIEKKFRGGEANGARDI